MGQGDYYGYWRWKYLFDGDPTQPQLLKPNNRELIQQYN